MEIIKKLNINFQKFLKNIKNSIIKNLKKNNKFLIFINFVKKFQFPYSFLLDILYLILIFNHHFFIKNFSLF